MRERLRTLLEADSSTLHVLVGPSGCGKTTLLRALATDPDAVFRTSEDLVVDLLRAMRADVRPNVPRPGTLWLVDDLDLLGQKQQTVRTLALLFREHLATGGHVVCGALSGAGGLRPLLAGLRAVVPVATHRLRHRAAETARA